MRDHRHDVDLHSRPLSSVAKVMGVLDAVSRADGAIGVRELARATGIDRSAVSRVATSLRALEVLAVTDDGSCLPGPALWALADRLRRSSAVEVESARIVDLLCQTTGETAVATVGELTTQRVAHVALGRGPVTVVTTTGAISPLSGLDPTADGSGPDPSATVSVDGAVYVGLPVGFDERGRTWWLEVAIPEQRAYPETVELATRALREAALDLRRVTPVVAR